MFAFPPAKGIDILFEYVCEQTKHIALLSVGNFKDALDPWLAPVPKIPRANRQLEKFSHLE